MAIPNHPLLEKDTALYYGNSMRRVFTPGDLLVCREIPFDDFQPGDIAAFFPPDQGKSGIVHRIIARDRDCLTTMGDNNPCPDRHRVTPDDTPRLVIARRLSGGRQLPVTRGRDGLRQFRINRIRRAVRLFAGRIVRRTARLFGLQNALRRIRRAHR